MTREILINFYSNALLAIKCAHFAGKPVLAKPALLITTIDAIGKSKVMDNKLFYDNLKEIYADVCMELHIKETMMSYPFYFLASENFWNLHWNSDPVQTKSPTERMIHDKIDYAYLDNALWDLLQDFETREILRESIIKHFFNTYKGTVSMTSDEDKLTSSEATNRQLWALRCATGIDYRGKGLTKKQAAQMIKEANEKSGYRKKGGMDKDEYNAKKELTKKNKEYSVKKIAPGSLEEVLSKCKTREEQLEAARKYFGEDK